ncbi:MAG: hypothetical protein Q8928_17955 [Bacteroidota bacterium]|nr:hypothetical protein [Bacteroidota bacterium]
MKKSAIVFTMFLAFIVVSKSYGQDSIKANYRDFLTELNVNLFQGELSLSNALKEVKGRYMFEKDKALRGGLIIDSKRETGEELTMSKKKYTRTSTLIGFSVGIEKHFPGTKRLSPYIGCDLFVANKWTKEKDTFYGSTAATINGAWEETQIVSTTGMLSTTTTTYAERGYFSWGVNFISGFDFYIAKHLFVGYEVEFGLTGKQYSKIEESGSYKNTISPESNEFSIGPRIVNGIRIGYVF